MKIPEINSAISSPKKPIRLPGLPDRIPVFCKITEITVTMNGKRYIIMIINIFRISVILPSLYFP
jgi:hypothetical protein